MSIAVALEVGDPRVSESDEAFGGGDEIPGHLWTCKAFKEVRQEVDGDTASADPEKLHAAIHQASPQL